MTNCKDCIHDKVCPVWNYITDDFAERNANACENYLPTVDVIDTKDIKSDKKTSNACIPTAEEK